MSYIIKLISENCYIIPDDDGWPTITESREEAIDIGLWIATQIESAATCIFASYLIKRKIRESSLRYN